ncbi:alanine--glyoxylate aminotransferase family protein [candidate division WOR-3 bacterium]|nr:alanine--glyoxylate aminotransferase family protein [candidate division WOR-3 bacterium]
MKHKKLFIPGPVEVSEDVLKEMGHFMIGHRSKDYSELHGEVVPKLKKLLYTENDVFLGTHSSTGWMEAAIRNCAHKKVLACVNGAFSKRWFQMTAPNMVEADKYEVEWGHGHDPKEIDKLLSTGKYDCFLVVHNETSTGVMNKINEISDVLKKYPDVSFCVDCVSSMTGIKIEVDKLGIDVCLAGVQKAFALPPGLAVAAVSKKALEKSAKAKNKGYYFDFVEFKKYQDKNQTPTTPTISHIFALNKQLDKFFAEGLEKRFARHLEMATFVREWAKKNFALFAQPGYESVTLTCITNTKGIDVADLNKKLGEKGLTISNGYGDLKEKTFRIAHMGDFTITDVKEVIAAIDEILGF